jgi:hypothetical protein
MRKTIFILIIASLVFFGGCTGTSLIEQSRTIAVQGTGRVTVAPDIASLSITVSELAETTSEAQQLTNRKVAVLLEMIREAGVADSDIRTTALSFSPEYTWKENERILVGQRVQQSLYVIIRGIDGKSTTLPHLMDSFGTVSGITMGAVQFSKDDTTVEYEASRKLAMEKAIQKASDYALAAGMQLGKPLTVSDYSSNDYQPLNRSSAMKADVMMMESAVSTELPSGEITISSSVSVVFELQ